MPKVDAAHAQPDDLVQLSRTAKAAQIALKDDLLTAVGYRGYRMVRATHGVASGSWYYEVKVNTLQMVGYPHPNPNPSPNPKPTPHQVNTPQNGEDGPNPNPNPSPGEHPAERRGRAHAPGLVHGDGRAAGAG